MLSLGLDTFAVAAGFGLARLDARQRLRVSLAMAGFEAGMPLVGLAISAPLGRAIGSGADYIAAGLLLAFGLHTLVGDEDDAEERAGALANLTLWSAILLGLTVSIDELAIGLTLGLLRLPIVPVIVLIGVQALVLSQLGLRLGARLSSRVGEGAERLAGLALTALGVGLLLEKLLAR
ncbi:MAG: hypothetical protein NVSMB25_12510 [Thermoleophilaceae bacterium]